MESVLLEGEREQNETRNEGREEGLKRKRVLTAQKCGGQSDNIPCIEELVALQRNVGSTHQHKPAEQSSSTVRSQSRKIRSFDQWNGKVQNDLDV